MLKGAPFAAGWLVLTTFYRFRMKLVELFPSWGKGFVGTGNYFTDLPLCLNPTVSLHPKPCLRRLEGCKTTGVPTPTSMSTIGLP